MFEVVGLGRLVVSFGRDAGFGVVKVGNVQKDPYVAWGVGHIGSTLSPQKTLSGGLGFRV